MKKPLMVVAAAAFAFAAGVLSGQFIPKADAAGITRDEAPSSVTVVPSKDSYQFHVVVVQGDRLYVTEYPSGGELPLELKPHAILKR